jgi:hypothetical protein
MPVTLNKVIFTAVFLGLLNIGNAANDLPLKWNQTEARAEMRPGDDQAKLQFTIKNSGDAPVRINRIESSAGNVSTLIDRRIIQSNGQSVVTAIFNRGKRTGKHHERLFVYLDDESDPISILHVFVHIPILIKARPQILYWAPDSLKKENVIAVDLDNRYINSIDTIAYDPLRLNVTRVEDPKKRADFLLRVSPLNYNLPLRDVILIRGKDKNGSPAEARIQVSVRSN